mmetsp:Transcript_104573/g.180206  ORF Transcript_104573/g.180206 Transcript_104573/m.180206 type:complete len:228 (-) Transcript_104573:748-1431(-)
MATQSASKVWKTTFTLPLRLQALGSPKRRLPSSHPCSPYRLTDVECRPEVSSPLSYGSQASLSDVPMTVPLCLSPDPPVGVDRVEGEGIRRPPTLDLGRVPSLSMSFFRSDGTPSTQSTITPEEKSPSRILSPEGRGRRVHFRHQRLEREISSLCDRQVALGMQPHSPKPIKTSHLPKEARWTEKSNDVVLAPVVEPPAGDATGLLARRMARRASAPQPVSAPMWSD